MVLDASACHARLGDLRYVRGHWLSSPAAEFGELSAIALLPSDDEAASVPSDDDQSLATFMSGLGSLNGVVSLTGNRVGPWSAPSSRAGTARQSTRSRKSLGDDPE